MSSLELNSEAKTEIREKISYITVNDLKGNLHVSIEEKDFSKKVKLTNYFPKGNPDIFFTNSDKDFV